MIINIKDSDAGFVCNCLQYVVDQSPNKEFFTKLSPVIEEIEEEIRKELHDRGSEKVTA